MSKKDVLHIPLREEPIAPAREADTEREEEHPHHGPPLMYPDGGPGNGPGEGGDPHIIEPVGSPRPYPGVSVT
jgi:hypothetical protein